MRTSDRRKYLIPPASQPDSIIMALETRSEARLPACHAIVAPMRERHTRSPGIADVPLRSPSAAAEGKMPFPPSNGAFGTAWKHVPPAQGVAVFRPLSKPFRVAKTSLARGLNGITSRGASAWKPSPGSPTAPPSAGCRTTSPPPAPWSAPGSS